MESAEVKKLQKDVFEKLKTKREILERVQEISVSNQTNRNFTSNISYQHIQGEGGAAIANTSASLSKALQTEIQSSSLTEDIVEDELQIKLNLLNNLNIECKQKELIDQVANVDLHTAQKRLNELKKRKAEIEKIIAAREVGGEMAELRGYSKQELAHIEKKVKHLFTAHKTDLKSLLKNLFPKDSDQMQTLLSMLTGVLFDDSGETYIDLDDHPDLESAATLLLQSKIVATNPHYKNKICLCIFE